MPGRRRVQRSVRVTCAVVLTTVSAVLVVAGLVVGTVPALAAAAVCAAVLGGAAARIMHGEIAQTRLEAARSRAQQARAFAAATTRTYSEHRAFAAAAGSRLAARDRAVGELEGALARAGARADEALIRAVGESQRANREARRADDAEVRAERESQRADREAHRADDALTRAARESARADRQTQRADDAQARLNALLDDVLAYGVAPLDFGETVGTDGTAGSGNVPTGDGSAATGDLAAADDPGDGYPVTTDSPGTDALPAVVDLLAWEERNNAASAAAAVRKHA
jgi:hypothetical protein